MSIALYAQKLWTCVVQCLPYIVKYVVLLHDIAFVFKALIREMRSKSPGLSFGQAWERLQKTRPDLFDAGVGV